MLLKMKIKVKITATLEIDDEEYHVPADENVGEEIENSFEEFLNTPEVKDLKEPLPIDNVTDNVIKVNFERTIERK